LYDSYVRLDVHDTSSALVYFIFVKPASGVVGNPETILRIELAFFRLGSSNLQEYHGKANIFLYKTVTLMLVLWLLLGVKRKVMQPTKAQWTIMNL